MRFDDTMSLSKMEKSILEEIKGKELWGDIDFSENDYICLRERLKAILRSNGNVDLAYICRYYSCCITTFLIFMLRFKYKRYEKHLQSINLTLVMLKMKNGLTLNRLSMRLVFHLKVD